MDICCGKKDINNLDEEHLCSFFLLLYYGMKIIQNEK